MHPTPSPPAPLPITSATAADVLSGIEATLPALRRYALALLRTRQDADDLVQETLVRALKALHTRHGDGDIRAWLFAIMHNLFVSRLRRARHLPAMLALSEAGASGQPGGQEGALRWRDMVQAINHLPIEQRMVVLLVSVEDFSYAEVAHVLGVPVGTVTSRLARGRERLRSLMEGSDTARPGQAGSTVALRRVK